MKINIKNAKTLLAISLLGATAVSQAAFIAVDTVTPVASTIDIVPSNYFKSTLAGLGVTTYTLGASLGLDSVGSVTYYYYGKEAGYRNDFLTTGLAYSSDFTPTIQNRFASPIEIGTVNTGPGLLDFGFCSYSTGTSLVGCSNNAQNDALGIASFQSIAFSITGNTAWLFWDDSGAGPDDNHDDMIIKAVFTPSASVPEPGTLALFGLGLLTLGFAANRRQRAAQQA